MYCNYCGNLIDSDSKFCIKCGYKVTIENLELSRTDYDKACILNQEYGSVLSAHSNNIEQIGVAYSIANNLTLPNSPEMQKVILLCLKDIELAPIISQYSKEMAKLYRQPSYITNYYTFQRLAIIYEKQKDYKRGVDTCKKAILLGFYQDGTTGQMPGRLARLTRKAKEANLKISNKIATTYCLSCQEEIDINSKFCNYCGAKQ